MVKGHLRDHDGKSKGKTEQARKVRAKPVGRNQLGVKMQLSHFYSQKNMFYTYLFLIMLITLITSSILNDAFVLNANDMPIKVMFI